MQIIHSWPLLIIYDEMMFSILTITNLKQVFPDIAAFTEESGAAFPGKHNRNPFILHKTRSIGGIVRKCPKS